MQIHFLVGPYQAPARTAVEQELDETVTNGDNHEVTVEIFFFAAQQQNTVW